MDSDPEPATRPSCPLFPCQLQSITHDGGDLHWRKDSGQDSNRLPMVKLEARYNDRTYPIELEEKKSSDPGSHFEIKIQRPGGEQVFPVRVVSRSQDHWTLEIDGQIENVLISRKREEVLIDWKNRIFAVQIDRSLEKLLTDSVPTETPRIASLTAQMTGKVISVLAIEGEEVKVGQGMAIIEAMKMQNELRSPKSGIVTTCNIREGETVNTGDLLFEID